MATEKDTEAPNTSVPQDGVIESEVGGRARTSDPTTSAAEAPLDPNTSVPQDDK